MASASPDSEEEFSEQNSSSDFDFDFDSDSDFDENEIVGSFGKETISLSEEDSLEIPDSDTEEVQKDSALADSRGTKSISSSQDLELQRSQMLLKKLSQFIWKSIAEAKYASILNDFVESEFFVIDGDSLLIRCLDNQGPYLSFIYSVECFLNDFIKKGAKYVIVFFKDVELIYFSIPNILLLRTILIQHLERNTDIVLYKEFSNCLSEEWQIFLQENYPYFMMISDIGLTYNQTHYLHIFLSHTLSKKINVVLPSEDNSDALRIYAYHVQSMYRHRIYFEQQNEHLLHAYENMLMNLARSQDGEQHFHGHLKFCLRKMHKVVCQTILALKDLWPEGSDIRHATCILTCAAGLKIYMSMLEKARTEENLKERQMEQCNEKDGIEELTMEEVADLCRIQCLSVAFHCNLSLSQRAQIRVFKSRWNEQALPFIEMLQRCDYLVLKQLSNVNDWKLDFMYLPDLKDNCLWKNLVYYYEQECHGGLQVDVGKEIANDYQLLWDTATTLSGLSGLGGAFPVRSTSKLFLRENQTISKEVSEVPSIGLIAVKSDIVEEYVGSILKDLPFLSSNDSIVALLPRYKEFDELRHWHSGRPLSDDYDRTKCDFEGKSKDPYKRKQLQKFQDFYQLYGSTLNSNKSQLIVKQEAKATRSATAVKKSKPKSKVERIVEENQKRLKAKEEKKEEEQWRALEKSIQEDMKTNFTSGINRFEKFLKTCQSSSVKFHTELAGLNFILDVWKEHCRNQGDKPKDFNIAVQLMRRIHMLVGKSEERLQTSDLRKLARSLQCLGFEKLALSLKCQSTESGKEKNAKYTVGMGAARFQLQYMGQYLFRDERSDSDPRIQHFIPDTWQRELLDVVDNNESAVIVAPTSSGKTYASYYCMEKILKESDYGVVVYVSPTKALVNQVVATVHNQFTKKLPNGLVVCGVFTRDYRHDTLNCQVLVTVPQCLEILLLSPHRQAWVKRIKYVIFDEVHCLGGEIGAEVWEHLLVMIRCPFLALSATVSNPEHLTEWLQSVKRFWQQRESTMVESNNSFCTKNLQKQNTEKKSYRVRLVLYGERYNDLEKYVCSLKNDDIVIDHYHPCAALTVNHIEKFGFPLDTTFSPRESIQLYDTMLEAWPGWPRAQELDPEEFIFFKDKIVIKKSDAKQYEQALKKELTDWVVHQKDKVKNVLESLKPHPVDSSEHEKRRKFALFVDKLYEMGKLPAIFFMFNIFRVEETAKGLLLNLLNKQRKNEKPTVENEIHILTEKLNKMGKRLEKFESFGIKKQAPSKTEKMIIIYDQYKDLKRRLKIITKTPQECTYVNHKNVDEEVFSKIFYRLRFAKNYFFLKMLARRGIGFHHSSMCINERQSVEMLFRMGHIQVVTATSTLALGINMPCKSVVFAEDSVYLDALNYRQMSGRAGRRGQDFLGNVFFYDIPLPKVDRLLKSNVPELKGQFPLSITFILRLMLLAEKAEDKVDAKAKVLSLLNHSLLSFKQPKKTEMLKIYFIFSLQLLLKEGFLDQECKPMGYAGLVTHLHYHEPSNFVLVDFLTRGLLHKLCQPSENNPTTFSEDVMTKLVLVLAHLFGRRHLPACCTKLEGTFFQSKVFLDDLPEEFADAVRAYNRKIEDNFGCFLLTAAKSKLANMDEEYHLPLTKIDFSGGNVDNSGLASHLMNCTKRKTAVSPFACLSGMEDKDLLSIQNVNKAVLRTLNVNASYAPVLLMEKYDCAGRRMPLNAYALDFYKHGSLEALAIDNCINRGDAYNLIQDFALITKAIAISLDELCENKDDNVVLAFKQLAESYKTKLEKV